MTQQLNVIPRKHLCAQLGISSNTIKRWIEYRSFPKPLKASGQEPLFDSDAVNLWFEQMIKYQFSPNLLYNIYFPIDFAD